MLAPTQLSDRAGRESRAETNPRRERPSDDFRGCQPLVPPPHEEAPHEPLHQRHIGLELVAPPQGRLSCEEASCEGVQQRHGVTQVSFSLGSAAAQELQASRPSAPEGLESERRVGCFPPSLDKKPSAA
eukprot:scaffold1187_cov258-Pinguiococcus_pyrenoidosus.AAC.7